VADVVVLGGGPTGLGTAILLAQKGLEVVVLDRDEAAPDDPEEAWASWQRRSVGQFRLVHFIQPGGRALLEDVGAIPYNHAEPQARRLPGGAGKDLDLTRFDTVTTWGSLPATG
jgi:2-polyprenyl-6-methoxyphenol hydroxylase-like FAD-dependent oxidoreductase